MGPLLDALDAAFQSAGRTLWIESYIVRDDTTGAWLSDALTAAARRGVDVRLLYDPLGSEGTSTRYFAELESASVRVRAYRAGFNAIRELRPFPRDHGRVIVVDDEAYTGGAAFGDEWLPRDRGGEGWRDVCVAVVGPVVDDFRTLFQHRFDEASGTETATDYDTNDRYPDVRLIADSPHRTARVHDNYRRRIQSARTRVWLEHAYFYPTGDMLRDLAAAGRRGVDVRVIVPAESDLQIVQRAARAEYGSWLKRGIRVFERRAPLVHSKVAVVDNDWTSVGSFNANPTSLAFGNEVALVATEASFAARVAAYVERSLGECDEVDRDALRRRPYTERLVNAVAADLLGTVDDLFTGRK